MACFGFCRWRILPRSMRRVETDLERTGTKTLLSTCDGSCDGIGVGNRHRRPQRDVQERIRVTVQSSEKISQNQTQDGLQCCE